MSVSKYMGYHKYLRQNNQRKRESFSRRYSMTAKEWAKLKKEDPQGAHELRMRVQNPAVK